MRAKTEQPKKQRRVTLKRWEHMDALGAKVYDKKQNAWVPVEIKLQGLAFFRDIAEKHIAIRSVPQGSLAHVWLVWLIEGHYDFEELCPLGVERFTVHHNYEIGEQGSALGFGVVAVGADGFSMPFSVGLALEGAPKTNEDKIRRAFRHAIEADVSAWRNHYWRPGLFCRYDRTTPLDATNVEVDHDTPFKKLIDAFCRQEGYTLSQLAADAKHVENVFNGKNKVWHLKEPLRTQWRNFHRQEAVLQFVSIKGHLELGRQRDLEEKLEEKLKNITPG